MPICNPALKGFWWQDKTIRIRVLYGGRSSSKSYDAAAVAIIIASKCKIKFLCVRQFQARIEDSVYTLLKQTIVRLGLSSIFNVQRNKIICTLTGSQFVFFGLWRNIEEIRGMEGIGICWIEEGHMMTEEQWQILEPTIIRNQDYQIWVIFNPRLATDFCYKRFVISPPRNTLVRKINYLENQFLNKQAIDVIEELKEVDYEEYEHIYLGNPRDNDDDSIIKRSWIMAAIDAHKKLKIEPTGTKRLGFDVADSGADKCATVLAHGWVITGADMWKGKEDELLKSCTRAYNNALKYEAQITYDSIGVGAGSGAKFKELNGESDNRLQYAGFNAGGAVFNPDGYYEIKKKNRDMFSNIKAQAWWLLGDRFRNTYNAVNHGQEFKPDELISIDSNTPFLELLIDELSTPKRDYDQAGRVKVESKKDLAKRDIPSPNLADAAVMAFAPGYSKIKINNSVFGII